MKIKLNFISNSSSASFLIKNKTQDNYNIEEFIIKYKPLIYSLISKYSLDTTFEEILEEARKIRLWFFCESTQEEIFSSENSSIEYLLKLLFSDSYSDPDFEWEEVWNSQK